MTPKTLPNLGEVNYSRNLNELCDHRIVPSFSLVKRGRRRDSRTHVSSSIHGPRNRHGVLGELVRELPTGSELGFPKSMPESGPVFSPIELCCASFGRKAQRWQSIPSLFILPAW